MSYDSLKGGLGRKPVTVVEIDIGSCALTYGISPCTASIPETGDRKCYNTFQTCQDLENYDATTKLFRFIDNTASIPTGVNLFACIQKVDYSPTRIRNDGLSERAVIKITMSDFPHHDRGVDPYVDERTFDPMDQGTFWTKFLARNPFYINREIRIKEGFVDPVTGFDKGFSDDFETRTYVIQDISQPNDKGTVVITAKDILKLADDRTAKAPAQSTGKLFSDITNAVTTIPLDDSTGYPTGGGIIRIGEELITYTGVSVNDLTGAVRGTNNTTAEAHSTDDEVQLCLQFISETMQDILFELLTVFAKIDPSFIPKADWDDEPFLQGYNLSTIITEPTGVNKLVGEITTQTSSVIWWDDVAQEIKLKAIAPPLPTEEKASFTEEDIIEGSISVIDREQDRISRVTVRFGVIDFTKDLQEPSNYRNTLVEIDANSESSDEYGFIKEKRIFSRWLTSSSLASEIAQRWIDRFRDTPKELRFSIDIRDNETATGSTIFVTTRLVVDDTGAAIPLQYTVQEDKLNKDGTVVSLVASLYNTGTSGAIFGLIGPDTLLDFTAESDANKATFMFIGNDSGLMSDGSPGYRIS